MPLTDHGGFSPDSGILVVTTMTSTHVVDLDAMTVTRRPGTGTSLDEWPVSDLRRDETPVPLVAIERLELGHEMIFWLRIRDDGVLTVRTTTPVVSIEHVGALAHEYEGTNAGGDVWVFKDGLALTNVHQPVQCAGRACVIHEPSEHHMRSWPLRARARDGGAYLERQCAHGIGHPDPDAAAYELSAGRDYNVVHGCDGCCAPPAD